VSDWATVALVTPAGELLILPISPRQALCAAPRNLAAKQLEQILSGLPLEDITEAVYGTQICLWPRAGEDLSNAEQKVAAAERVRSNVMRWRGSLPLRASVHFDLGEP
jgi:hypothetical protein